MVIGTAGDKIKTTLHQRPGQSLGILHHLLRIKFELRLQRFLEGDGLGGDDVHQRAALNPREDIAVEFLGVLFPAEDHAATRAAQGFVGSCGHILGIWNRIGVNASRHQTGNVGHIDHDHCSDLIGHLAESFEIDGTGISTRADHDHLRPVFFGKSFDLIVIDPAGFTFDAIGDDVKKFPGKVDRRTVRKMTAVRQVHPENRIARLTFSEIDRHVRLRTGMGLHIGMIGAKERLGTVDRQVLGDIDNVTAAVITLAGVAFCVFIGQHRALCFENILADKILRSDEFEVILLALGFMLDSRCDLRIKLLQTVGHGLSPPV